MGPREVPAPPDDPLFSASWQNAHRSCRPPIAANTARGLGLSHAIHHVPELRLRKWGSPLIHTKAGAPGACYVLSKTR